VDGLAEDAGTRRLWRRAAVVVGVVPPASARPVAPRLGLILVVSSSLKGGSRVHVGPDAFVDGWGFGAPSRVRGCRALHCWCLIRRGLTPGCLAPWDCDVELSVFCTTACSRRSRSPWRTLLPLGVDGSGIALRRSTAAITFWLAVLKNGGLSPPSSSTMRLLTSQARRLATPPSPPGRLVLHQGLAQLPESYMLFIELGL